VLDLFRESYYCLDLLVGYGSPILFYLLYRTGRIDRFLWHFYWIGVAVGLLWEIPIFVLSGEATSLPLVTWTRPIPAHYAVFMISHSLWDGLLFAAGVQLVQKACRAPHFARFSFPEFAVLFLWGQATELLVELSATWNDAWSFVENSWNPVLFLNNGHNIALLMQLIWGAAVVLYYYLLLALRPKYR
jgi:hypothetical protein